MRWLSLLFVAALAGCQNPNQTAYQATAITVSTVNAFESAYGSLYRAGLVPVPTQVTVSNAVTSYNAALLTEQAIVIGSLTNDLTSATVAVANAEAAIVSAISPLLSSNQVQELLLVK